MVSSWCGVKHGDKACINQDETAMRDEAATAMGVHPQMAIITPATMSTAMKPSAKDLDIRGPDLMPDIPHTEWPTPQRIQEAQQRAGIVTPYIDSSASAPMFTDVNDKIVLPVHDEVTEHVICLLYTSPSPRD